MSRIGAETLRRTRVRLCGINAPERGEPGVAEATEMLRNLVSRKMIRCLPVGQGTVCDGRSGSTNHDRFVAQCLMGATGTRLIRRVSVGKSASKWLKSLCFW